jgi:hypothetical protein
VNAPLAAAALLSFGLSAGCRDTTGADASLSETVTTEHYVFHRADGDAVNTTWQESYYDWLVSALALQPTGRLDYYKYRDRAHLRAVTGRITNGFAEPGTTRFHTIWPIDNHEGVHTLVILYMGHPPALFNEGVAVAHQTDPQAGTFSPRWNGQDLHTLAHQFDQSGQLPSLASLVRSTDFFSHDPNLTYPVAGSFVRYLLDTYGLAAFKTFLAGATFEDAPTVTEARFQAAYNRSLATAWMNWRSSLQ